MDIEQLKHYLLPPWLKRMGKLLDRSPNGTSTSLVVGDRGIGGAVAQKDDSGSFGNYFNSTLSRSGVNVNLTNFTEEVLNTLPDKAVRELVSKSSPIVAKATADYADAISSGFTWTSDRTLGQEPDTPAQQLIADFLARMETEHQGIEQLIAEAARGMFVHGGVFTELVIDKDGRTPLLIKILDPTTAAFRKNYDEKIGEFYELGQEVTWNAYTREQQPRRSISRSIFLSSVNFKSLHEDPTIQYRGIQTGPNNPYGNPIIDPAIFPSTIGAAFLVNFKQSITGYTWPTFHIKIDEEQFSKSIGVSVDPKRMEELLNAEIAKINKNIKSLKPGSALITGSEVEFGGFLSGQTRAPLGSVQDLYNLIVRDIIVGVQSQPILQASNEAVAETHAVEQNKNYGKTVRRGQKLINPLFTDYFNLILRLNNYPPLAEFRLSYVNTADYKDQSMTYSLFQDGLLKSSQDLRQFGETLLFLRDSNLITEEEMQERWAEGMEIRRQINILPQDL